MSINHLYHTWLSQIRQLRPGERITRLRSFTWLLVGIHPSKSVHLSKAAMKIPGAANLPSITRRLSRFLDNPAVRVREWYEPIATGLVQSMANTAGEIRLIADQLARPLEEGRKRTFWLCPVYDSKLSGR